MCERCAELEKRAAAAEARWEALREWVSNEHMHYFGTDAAPHYGRMIDHMDRLPRGDVVRVTVTNSTYHACAWGEDGKKVRLGNPGERLLIVRAGSGE